ncbi:hypothetical protein Tcan_02231 [Toxocara canis]|uniref:Uncharacterized protein n=1 Tax=Toxocara canis TaxID=6265 RepID=A0A0B2URD3_TOXCA|nr:hypothetical protein Tcan_02231 [Toxocara canis]
MVVASIMQQQPQQQSQSSSQPLQASPQHCNGQSTLEREDDSDRQDTPTPQLAFPPTTNATTDTPPTSRSPSESVANNASNGGEDNRQDTTPNRTISELSDSAVNDSNNGQHSQTCTAAGVEVRLVDKFWLFLKIILKENQGRTVFLFICHHNTTIPSYWPCYYPSVSDPSL